MENVKINLGVIEFNVEQPIVKKYVTLFVAGIVAIFIIYLNYIILNDIPNMYPGGVIKNAIFIFIPNAVLASVATSLMSLEVISGKVKIKRNKMSLPFFLLIAGAFSVTWSLVLNWAAGCSSDACDIREGCNYLLQMCFGFAATLLICSLMSFFITDLLFRYLYKKRNSFKWIVDFIFPDEYRNTK